MTLWAKFKSKWAIRSKEVMCLDSDRVRISKLSFRMRSKDYLRRKNLNLRGSKMKLKTRCPSRVI
jgi:hypothetical protein